MNLTSDLRSEVYLLIDTQRLCLDYNKFLIPRSLWSTYAPWRKPSDPCSLSPYCVLFTVPNNSSCSRCAWVVWRPKSCNRWKINSINHRKQSLCSTIVSSRSRYLQQALIHSTPTLDPVRNSCYILMLSRYHDSARFPLYTYAKLSVHMHIIYTGKMGSGHLLQKYKTESACIRILKNTENTKILKIWQCLFNCQWGLNPRPCAWQISLSLC